MKVITVEIDCDEIVCAACHFVKRYEGNHVVCTAFTEKLIWGETYPLRCSKCVTAEVKSE
jgi:hypothetical protein